MYQTQYITKQKGTVMHSTLSTQLECGPSRTTRFPVSEWLATARQRRVLARLDARALRDIGITRADAQAEAQRPFWDVN